MDSDPTRPSKKPALNFGMPDAMSKTFDVSSAIKPAPVPKLDFRKLKHVKEQKDWYGY